MQILVLAIGRLKEDYYRAAEAEYAKRLTRYTPFSIREVKDEAALIKAIPKGSRLVALDEHGASWSSEELANRLLRAEELHGGGRPVVFIIGGAEGISAELCARASPIIAFGRITLPHRLARIVLVEQLYRAYSILRGEPYHRG